MKLMVIAIIAFFALSVAQGYPLYGGNGATNCTIFGFIKGPLNNSSEKMLLKVDVGITTPENVIYQVMDDKNVLYTADSALSKQLQPGRSLQAFVISKTTRVFKLFKAVPASGSPITINWWKTPKESNGDLVIRYYGMTDYDLSGDGQSYIYEVGLGNNGTSSISVGPENFTLLDQNGWDYYTGYGFSPTVIEAGKAIRVRLSFTDLSPFSIPRVLAFDAFEAHPIVIDFQKDYGQLTDEVIYSSADAASAAQGAQTTSPPQVTPTPQGAPEVATVQKLSPQEVQAPAKKPSFENPAIAMMDDHSVKNGGRSSGVSSSLSSSSPNAGSVEDRLAAVQQKLKGR